LTLRRLELFAARR